MQSRFKSQMFLVYTIEKERNNNKITRTFPSFVCCKNFLSDFSLHSEFCSFSLL